MNISNIKKRGAMNGLLEEADVIIQNIRDYTEQNKYYECEQKAKDLQVIYTELLAMNKEK